MHSHSTTWGSSLPCRDTDQQRQQNATEAAQIFARVAEYGPASLRDSAEFNRDALKAQIGSLDPAKLVQYGAPPRGCGNGETCSFEVATSRTAYRDLS